MTQFSLKIIALVSMLLDHTAKVLLPTGVLIPYVGVSGDLFLRTMMMAFGRLSFPIFAWFVAEGCRKTKHPGKYLLRIGVFAILSELPFQYCFYGAAVRGVSLGCHNVMFTFLLAVGAIMIGEAFAKQFPLWIKLIPAVFAVALGWYFRTDYNAWGVLLVLLLYYIPEERERLLMLLGWITVFQLIWHGWNGAELSWLSGKDQGLLLQWLIEILAVPILACYTGEKGRGSKWLFYLFYPLHLTVLYLLSCLV